MSIRRTCQVRWSPKAIRPAWAAESGVGAAQGGNQRNEGDEVKQPDGRPRAGSEEESRGPDADHGVVLGVLQRVDRVVPHRPGDRRGIDREGGPTQAAVVGCPAHETAVGEGEPQHGLGPRCHALHQGVDRHEDHRDEAGDDGEAVEVDQDRQPDQAQEHGEDDRLARRHLPRGDRPQSRALDLRVEVAVEEIIVGAPGAAHGDRADEEEQQVRQGREAGAIRGSGNGRRPPARQQEQPPADRPVNSRQPQVWAPGWRREAVDDVSGRCVRDRRSVQPDGLGHRAPCGILIGPPTMLSPPPRGPGALRG